ncbi:MAG: metal-dependent phosphohydrolase [Propionibacteriaceae bacterium]|nr:metal-dependent phosphohydrolase [Propionibacteriaceae bacterium]
MSTGLDRAWAELLPGQDALGAELLARWREPHRHYHDTSHLAAALGALADVGGVARTERLAIWFHDAVFTGAHGDDERASAALAGDRLLEAGLPRHEVAEVSRLVLVTVHHSPAPEDAPGARVSDADLAVLGSARDAYAASVSALRAEAVAMPEPAWREARLARLAELLAAEPLFHTTTGQRRWLTRARANLVAEQQELLDAT